MVRQCLIIFGCLTIGHLLVNFTGVNIPASLIGMIILFCLLQLKAIELKNVQKVSDFFNQNIAFFFVPAGVGIMLYLDLLKDYFWIIILSIVISTILVITITGWIFQLMRKRNNKLR